MENEEITYGSVEIHQDKPDTYIPQNEINSPLQHKKEDLLKELQQYKKENARLRDNNEFYKLEYIAIKEKINNITKIINQHGTTF
jgi:predicted nuclease with TOPRIM domain